MLIGRICCALIATIAPFASAKAEAQSASGRPWVADYEQAAEAARDKLNAARQDLRDATLRAELGLLLFENFIAAHRAVARAETEVGMHELLLQEIRVSDKIPLTEVRSPLVFGRDFVSERWRLNLADAQAERTVRIQQILCVIGRTLFGLATRVDLVFLRSGTSSLDSKIQQLRDKLDQRERFLKGG